MKIDEMFNKTIVKGNNASNICKEVSIHVDTTELRNAIKEAKKLIKLLKKAEKQKKRLFQK